MLQPAQPGGDDDPGASAVTVPLPSGSRALSGKIRRSAIAEWVGVAAEQEVRPLARRPGSGRPTNPPGPDP